MVQRGSGGLVGVFLIFMFVSSLCLSANLLEECKLAGSYLSDQARIGHKVASPTSNVILVGIHSAG